MNGCYSNGYSSAGTAPAQECTCGAATAGGEGSVWSCIINLILIVVVLQFLTQILGGSGCDGCC